MSQRKLAHLMRQHGVRLPPRKNRPARAKPTEADSSRTRTLVEALRESEEEKENVQSVYRPPDSWAAPPRVQQGPPPSQEGAARTRPGPKKKAPNKRRSVTAGITVSPEEDFMLKKYAFDQGMNFSAWAREALFKAMGVSIPPRS